MSEYQYSITVTAEELIANGEGVAGGEWPETIIRNGLKYAAFDGRGNHFEYRLCFEEMLDEKDKRIAELEAENKRLRDQNDLLSDAVAFGKFPEAPSTPAAAPEPRPVPSLAPRFSIGQDVVIVGHIDKVKGTITAVRNNEGVTEYHVQRHYSVIMMWHEESELEAW